MEPPWRKDRQAGCRWCFGSVSKQQRDEKTSVMCVGVESYVLNGAQGKTTERQGGPQAGTVVGGGSPGMERLALDADRARDARRCRAAGESTPDAVCLPWRWRRRRSHGGRGVPPPCQHGLDSTASVTGATAMRCADARRRADAVADSAVHVGAVAEASGELLCSCSPPCPPYDAEECRPTGSAVSYLAQDEGCIFGADNHALRLRRAA